MIGANTATTTTTTTTNIQMPLLGPHLTTENSFSRHYTMTELPFALTPTQEVPEEEEPSLSPSRCLFCRHESVDTEANCAHMQRDHGLFIPARDRLAVDLDALVGYMHLVVAEYHECLFCGTERATAQAARQHMMGKGHCRIDIAEEGSEWRDFYDFEDESVLSEEDEDEDDTEVCDYGTTMAEDQKVQLWSPYAASRRSTSPTVVDDDSIRLPSGRIISNRSVPAPRHPGRKPLAPRADLAARKSALQSSPSSSAPEPEQRTDRAAPRRAGDGQDEHDNTDQNPPEATAQSSARTTSSTELLDTRDENHNKKLSRPLATQLANLRTADRQALSHLSVSEQRVVLAAARKEEGRAQRSGRKFRTHMDAHGNLKSKERFVNDVPGGKSHKNRFFAQ